MASEVKTIVDLQHERAGLVDQMRAMLDVADTDERELSAEEAAQYDKIEADCDAMGDAIDAKQSAIEATNKRRERAESLAEEMKKTSGRIAPSAARKPAIDPGTDGAGAAEGNLSIEAMLRSSDRREAYKAIAAKYAGSERAEALGSFCVNGWNGMNGGELAALQADSDTVGGTLVLPEEFVASLIQAVDDLVFMRQLAFVLPLTNAESIGVPSLDADPADADWTSELAIGGEDSTMATGKRALHPHPLAKLLKVSKTLLRKSVVPADALVRERLSHKFAVSEEKGFLTGSGSNQPLGVFTASALGISTGQDVSTGNSSTAVSADGLINAKFNLKSQYMASPSLRWILNRTVVRDIRKLKDGNGQYIWQAGLAGTPDSILEVPYLMSEFAPNTMTSGLYVGIIGDFSNYWIAESLRMELQRLDELYAATNQVGFVGRLEVDGMPVLEEAFTRVTLA